LKIETLKDAFAQANYEKMGPEGLDICDASIFAEKLFTARNMFGAIKAICKIWVPSQETLIQWNK